MVILILKMDTVYVMIHVKQVEEDKLKKMGI